MSDERTLTYRQAIGEAMAVAMRADPAVCLIGEDVGRFEGAFKVSKGLLDEFGPERVVDTPISEAGFVGMGIGAAMMGMRPIVELMTVSFSAVAFDQILNNAAAIHSMFGGQIRVPIVLRMPGGSGHQLAAQHSHSLEAIFTHIPGLKVATPATPADAKGLLLEAIFDDDPVIFLESEGLYAKKGPVAEGDVRLPFGQAVVRRVGSDVTIIAHARMVWVALQAAEELAALGIEATVIDPRTLRPLDVGTLADSVRATTRCVVVDEGWPECSVAQMIAAHMYRTCFDRLDAPIECVNGADVQIPYARELEQAALPQAADVIAAVRRVVGR